MRNLGEYEGLLEVDERLVTDLIFATQTVADALELPLQRVVCGINLIANTACYISI